MKADPTLAALDAAWSALRNGLSKAYTARDIDDALGTARPKIEAATLDAARLEAAGVRVGTPDALRGRMRSVICALLDYAEHMDDCKAVETKDGRDCDCGWNEECVAAEAILAEDDTAPRAETRCCATTDPDHHTDDCPNIPYIVRDRVAPDWPTPEDDALVSRDPSEAAPGVVCEAKWPHAPHKYGYDADCPGITVARWMALPTTWCHTHHAYDHCEDAVLAAIAAPRAEACHVCALIAEWDMGVACPVCAAAPRAEAALLDVAPGGNGFPSWLDPITGKDKDR